MLYYNTRMREYTFYMWTGLWLLLIPFLGVPGTWKETLTIMTALCVLVHSFLGYRRLYFVELEAKEAGSVSEAGTSSTV